MNQHYIEQEEDHGMKKRTLLFDSEEKPAYLLIKGLHYIKEYGDVIEIPIE